MHLKILDVISKAETVSWYASRNGYDNEILFHVQCGP